MFTLARKVLLGTVKAERSELACSDFIATNNSALARILYPTFQHALPVKRNTAVVSF